MGIGKNGYDDNGHGTHVAGIIAGESKDRFYGRMNINGIAKGSQLVVLKVLNAKGIGIEDKVIDGIKWIIDNYEKYNIKIVNIPLEQFIIIALKCV